MAWVRLRAVQTSPHAHLESERGVGGCYGLSMACYHSIRGFHAWVLRPRRPHWPRCPPVLAVSPLIVPRLAIGCVLVLHHGTGRPPSPFSMVISRKQKYI